MDLVLSAASKEYIKVKVTVRKNGAAFDPTGLPVNFAFTSGNDLTGATWSAGTWVTDTGEYFARYLMPGTGMAKGGYLVWLKVTDSPEVPVKKIGRVTLI